MDVDAPGPGRAKEDDRSVAGNEQKPGSAQLLAGRHWCDVDLDDFRRRKFISSCKFYTRKQLLLSARISHRNSVCPSVRHTGGSVKNGAS